MRWVNVLGAPGVPGQVGNRRGRRSVRRHASARRSAPQTDAMSGGQQRHPGGDARHVEPLGRRVVVAADRPEAVEDRHAHPGDRVRVRGAAGRGVAELEAQLARRARSPARRARPMACGLLHGREPAPSARTRPSRRGPRSSRPRAEPRPRPRRRTPGSRRACRPRARSWRATTFGRVPPWITPTLTVTPGQRPFSACSAIVACAAWSVADRPRSGSTPAWAARPWYVTRTSATPLRADTMSPFSRAPSRTKHASASLASSRMCGPLNGEPISSSGLQT